jgi:NTE family protein
MSANPNRDRPARQNVVLVFQGGGALGAYQAGVYEAIHEAGLQPDWVIGTSIGAINAGLIAGNPPEQRLDRLRRFWTRMQSDPWMSAADQLPFGGQQMAAMASMLGGLSGFFRPNPLAMLAPSWHLGADRAGYYSTEPMRETLADLMDINLINHGPCRLTVGAASVRSAEMRYFDSRDGRLGLEHIMASGALPPAFPPVRIDGELFWDGGILSNTPVEAVFDDNPRRDSLVFVVHLWNANGPEPDTLTAVMHRLKDVQYASRSQTHITRQRQLHRLRHVIHELAARLPEAERALPQVRELASYGCVTQMHVVRLLAPMVKGETHLKDIDFTPAGIRERWQAGYSHTKATLARAPWNEPADPMEGLILHEA